jgi:hypothetical protein
MSSLFSPASFAVSVFQLRQPIRKKIAWFSLLASVVLVAGISAAADGVIYKVRLENGVDRYFRLEVQPGVTPVKLNPSEWNQPQYATTKISPNTAVLAAVAWAGGLEDHDPGYSSVRSVPKLSRALERADWSNSSVVLCGRFGGWTNC